MSLRTLFLTLQRLCPATTAMATPLDQRDVHVIDGETVRLMDRNPNARLLGFNAPETVRAACPNERELGDRATRRLRELVRTEVLDFEFVACSCPPGTEGTSSCNRGRHCGTLKAGGRDVGDILIEERLAVPFKCGTARCPATPRPWCEGVTA
jgi:micrococcal nuclease